MTQRVAASNTSDCSLEHLGSQPPAHSHLDSALSSSILWLQEAQQRNEQRELACAAVRRQRHAAHEARQPGGGAVEIESKSNTVGSNRPATSEQMRQRRKELGLLSTKEARRAVLTQARARAILARARARARARSRAATLSRQLWSMNRGLGALCLAAIAFPGYHPQVDEDGSEEEWSPRKGSAEKEKGAQGPPREQDPNELLAMIAQACMRLQP